MDYINQKRIFFPFITPNTIGSYLAMSAPLLLTKSLGAIISFFFSIGIYFFLQDKLKKRYITSLTLLLSAIGIVFILQMLNHKEHLRPMFSALMRLSYWNDTLRIIRDHPFFGIGPGNLDLMQSTYAHNSYLQIWAEAGNFNRNNYRE